MATINRIQPIYTHEGAPAQRIDTLDQLERSVMSCLLFENELMRCKHSEHAVRFWRKVQIGAPDD